MVIPPVYPILDTATLDRKALDPLTAAEAFLEAGARILQYRHKAFWTRDAFLQAEQVARLAREAEALFIINDRADYAALLNAGVHVGQDDLTPEEVRRVAGSHSVVGFSTHTLEQMRAALDQPADYLAFGPIFTTASKERPDPTVGPLALKAIRTLTAKPLVAIGGITLDNASACWDAGADSVAVIAGLLPDPCTKNNLRDRMTDWLHLSAMLHKWQ